MKVLLLALVLVSAQVAAVEWKGNTVTLSEQEMAACQAGGCCILATRAAMIEVGQIMQKLAEELKAAIDKPAPSCRRDTI